MSSHPTMHVLVVVKYMNLARLYYQELSEAGFSVDIACNEEEAGELLSKNNYSMLLIDPFRIMSYKFLQHQAIKTRRIPIVVNGEYSPDIDVLLHDVSRSYVKKSSNVKELLHSIFTLFSTSSSVTACKKIFHNDTGGYDFGADARGA